MNGLVAIAAVVAVVDWVAVARRPSPVEFAAKPLVLVALIGAAVALDPANDAQRAWFVVALTLSLAGDVFLLPKPDAFVPGLASFLLAHAAYVVGFAQVASLGWRGLVPIPVILVVAARVVPAVRRSDAALVAPVVVYIAVIGAMVCAAMLTDEPLAVVGAWSFAASDSMLALGRFDRPWRWSGVAVMVTYHAAQALLVLSLVR